MLESWIADAHFAMRRLRAHPSYAWLAVLTLGLGVGGTASTYSVARRVLFDPLPYTHEREVGVFWKKTDWREEEFLYIRGRVPGFREVALYRLRDMILREGDDPARLVPESLPPPSYSKSSVSVPRLGVASNQMTMRGAPSRWQC